MRIRFTARQFLLFLLILSALPRASAWADDAAPRLVPYAELEQRAAGNSKERFLHFGDGELLPGGEYIVCKVMEWQNTPPPIRPGQFGSAFVTRLLGCVVVRLSSGTASYVELPSPENIGPLQDDWTVHLWSDHSLLLVHKTAVECPQQEAGKAFKPPAVEWRFYEEKLVPLEGFKPAHSLAATLNSLGIEIAPDLRGNACQWDGAVSLVDTRRGRRGRFLTQNTWQWASRMAFQGPMTENERSWAAHDLNRGWVDSEQFGPSFNSSTVLYLQRFLTPKSRRLAIGCTSLFRSANRAPLRWSRDQAWFDKAAEGVVTDARFVPGQAYPAGKLSVLLVVAGEHDDPSDRYGDREAQWWLLNTDAGVLERQLPIRLEPLSDTDYMPAVVNAAGTLGAGTYSDDESNSRCTLYDLGRDRTIANRPLDYAIAGFSPDDSLILYDEHGIWRLDPPYDGAPREVIKPWPKIDLPPMAVF